MALLGAGWVAGTCYAPALSEAGLRLAAVADLDRQLAQSLVARLGQGRVAADPAELLTIPSDLVVVATPNGTHAGLSRQALSAGLRVLCEKPLASRRRDVEPLVEPGRGRLFVSCPFRFRPDVRALLALCAGGEIGKLHRLRLSWTRARGIPRPGSWYTNRRLALGGVLIDLGSHLLDLALLLLKTPVARVSAWTKRLHSASREHAISWMEGRPGDGSGLIDVEDQAVALLEFEGGGILELHVSWAGYQPCDRTCIEVEGSAGTAVLETLFGYSAAGPPEPPKLRLETGRDSSVREFAFERSPAADFGAMLRAVLDSEDGSPAVADVTHTLRVVDAVERIYGAALTRPNRRLAVLTGALQQDRAPSPAAR